MKDCLGDEQWASTLADKIYPEHSSILHALLSSFNDVVEFLMASVKFKSAKEKLNGICLAKVKNIRRGNVRGSVRLTRRKLASLTCEVQADDSTKELVQKVEACFKEKQEAPKKVKRRKRKHAFNVGYKRKSGDELRLVQKRDIVSSHVLCLYIFFYSFCAIYSSILRWFVFFVAIILSIILQSLYCRYDGIWQTNTRSRGVLTVLSASNFRVTHLVVLLIGFGTTTSSTGKTFQMEMLRDGRKFPILGSVKLLMDPRLPYG